jgi:hypothetical protein
MDEINAPKKERKFLKAIVKIGKVLAEELVMGIGRKFIGKVVDKVKFPKKREMLSFALILSYSIAFAQYPATGNKQRLGYQTTGDGLVWRGRASDTVALKSSGINNAYFILDTINNIFYNYIKTKGGWKFSNGDTLIIYGAIMPFDSIIFNTGKNGTVGIGEMEYNDTQGSLIQGLKGGIVTNVIGQQLHQRVNNRTGATLEKGTAVYLSGSQGNRITVAKALATSNPTSANTFGIVAESIANNQSGYVITEGLITNINTSALVEDSAVYLSPTVAGALTSTKPQAPFHSVYIGVCVKSNPGSGELFVSIKNGLEITELHDVRITTPVDKASLYYKSSEGLWRDTTATLLVSDTASMLTPYFKKLDTTFLNLTSRFATKLNISDTASMLTNYNSRINLKLNISDTTLMLSKYLKKADTSLLNLNTRFAAKLSLLDTASMLTNYLRSGIAASTYLTQSSAASTYLPLAGGTVTGNTSFTQRLTVGASNNYDVLNVHHNSENGFRMSYSSEPTNYYFQLRPIVTSSNVRYAFSQTNLNVFYDSILVFNNGNVAINKLNPTYKLDVNGTLGVTGATTLSSTLAVTGNITEGGNNVLTNLDTTSLSSRIDGKVSLNGSETINGSKSFNNVLNVLNQMTISGSVSGLNKILGKNTDGNGVGDITVGTGLNLTSNTLNATVIDTASMLSPYWRSGRFSGTLPIANGGTNATSASGARNNLDVDYVFFATTAGSAVSLTSNRVYIVNTGSFSTTTLDLTPATSGRMYMVKNLASGTIISSASNVIPLNGGSPSTPILSAGNVTPQWCTLVCDGTNWHIIQRN